METQAVVTVEAPPRRTVLKKNVVVLSISSLLVCAAHVAHAEDPPLAETAPAPTEPVVEETIQPTSEPAPATVNTDGYLPGESETGDGYLPEVHPDNKPPPPIAGPRSPIQGGMRLMAGFQIPTSGDLRNDFGERDIRGTGDLGLGIFMSLYDRVELGTAFRIGLGGFDSGYQVSGTEGNSASRHFWVGADWRLNLTTQTRVRPFLSGTVGGDRIVDVFKSPTGAYECEPRGTDNYYCTEETERAFAIGYWGLSTGFGGGIQIRDVMKNGSIVIEFQGVRNRYGRLTSSGFENQTLGDDARSTWQLGTLIMFQVHP